MPTIADIRQKYPQYSDMSDVQLADALHRKHYSDLPKEEFYSKIGMQDGQQKPKTFSERMDTARFGGLRSGIEKYVAQPTLHAAEGFVQGTANIAPGIYNLGSRAVNALVGTDLPRAPMLDVVPHGYGQMAGEFGSLLTGAGAISGTAGGLSNLASKIPGVENILARMGGALKSSPTAANALRIAGSEPAKNIAANALLGAATMPDSPTLGAGLGGGGAALGELAGTNPVARTAMRVLGGATIGGVAAPFTGHSPLTGAIGGGIAGGLAPSAIKALSGKPAQEVMNYLTPEMLEKAAPVYEAGERLGRTLSPAEALRNPYLGARQGIYSRTGEAAAAKSEIAQQNKVKEASAIKKLLNKIYTPGTEAKQKIRDLYNVAYESNVPPELLALFKQNPVIADAFERVANNSAFQSELKGAPQTSVKYLDYVKRALDDIHGGLKKDAQTAEATIVDGTRRNFTEHLDNFSPAYKDARAASQLPIIRRQIIKTLKKGEADYGGSMFFKKIIDNDLEFEKLHKSLKNAPEAQAMLSDMRLAWRDLINPEKVGSAAFQSEKSLSAPRATPQALMEMFQSWLGTKTNKKAVELVNSPEWMDLAKKANAATTAQERTKLYSDLFGRLVSASTLSAARD